MEFRKKYEIKKMKIYIWVLPVCWFEVLNGRT